MGANGYARDVDASSLPLAPPSAPRTRVPGILREIARGGLAGVIAGLVVGGVGGRIVMRIAALLDPSAVGRRTDNGELVGAITVDGTLALLLFGGLFAGIAAGVIWVVVSPWIPGRRWRRWTLVMPIAVALGGFILVGSRNPDFNILGPDAANIAMLLLLVALTGAAVASLDAALDRRLPAARSMLSVVAYGAVVAVGLAFLPVVVDLYNSLDICACQRAPRQTALALLVVGLATAGSWVYRIATGRPDVPRPLVIAGRVGLGAAVIVGFVHLGQQISLILAAG